jgi:predicted RNA-binding protein with PUA-like domain
MSYWILKTEPSTYSHADLQRDQETVWDGVSNPVALKNIRAMQPGDEVLVYHTGDEKACVGLAKVASAPFLDPKDKSGKLAVVKLKAGRKLAQPVTLAQVKAEKAFADFALVRQPRLSVIAASAAQWSRLLKMAGEPG